MSAAPRQGSSAFTLVLAGLMAVFVGAMVLTFAVYPLITGFQDVALFNGFDTTAGTRVGTYVEGFFVFTGGFIMLAIIAFVWIRTRQ
jgi:hypothetical protein